MNVKKKDTSSQLVKNNLNVKKKLKIYKLDSRIIWISNKSESHIMIRKYDFIT